MALNDGSFRTMKSEEQISRHNMKVFQKLQDDYLGEKRLCDTEIILKYQEKIRVHSIVLDSFSRYCRQTGHNSYEFADIELYNMKNVIGWMYYANIEIEIDQIAANLEVCKRLDITVLYQKIERKVLKLARENETNIIDLINNMTTGLKIIPFGTATILPFTDITIGQIVDILHEKRKKLTYRDILRLTNYSVITIISARVSDDKKVDVINLALRWIQERRLSADQVQSVLRHLTFGAMTMEMQHNFAKTLIRTVIPVETGKCVRLKKCDKKIDIVFGNESDWSNLSILGIPSSSSNSSSSSTCSTSRSSWTIPSIVKEEKENNGLETKLNPFTDSQFEYINKLATEHDRNMAGIDDDCSTAVSFCLDDLLRLGIDIPMNTENVH